jgi:hypothetical protein
MNIDELEATLPNGLHDALICSYTFSEEKRRDRQKGPSRECPGVQQTALARNC